jgi:hypothetical protein
MMRADWLTRVLGFALVAVTLCNPAMAAEGVVNRTPRDQSFANEVEHALSRGLTWLQSNQNSNGWWSTPEQPAVTALVLTAFKGDPKNRYRAPEPAWLQRGFDFVLASAQPDGGIHRSNLITYNTSISMMALLAANKPEYDPVILRARKFLVGLQGISATRAGWTTCLTAASDTGQSTSTRTWATPSQALEAIYHSRSLVRTRTGRHTGDLELGRRDPLPPELPEPAGLQHTGGPRMTPRTRAGLSTTPVTAWPAARRTRPPVASPCAPTAASATAECSATSTRT